jgi:hypothetical protein
MLVAKLNLFGWQISRETLAKVETQIRWVADFELVTLAVVFGLSPTDLLPPDSRRISKSLLSPR